MNRITKKVYKPWEYECVYEKYGIGTSKKVKKIALGDLEHINKLGKIEDKEEELGISFLTLINCLEYGIYYKNKKNGRIFHCGEAGKNSLEKKSISKEFVFCTDNGNKDSIICFSLSNYGKTWAYSSQELGA